MQVEPEEADYFAAAVLACTVLVLQVVVLVLGALSLKSANSTLQHIQQNGEGVNWRGSLNRWKQAMSSGSRTSDSYRSTSQHLPGRAAARAHTRSTT